MTLSLLLGIDVGTTSAKATLYDEHGRICGRGRELYSIMQPSPGLAEQDPAIWWQATARAVGDALSSTTKAAVVEGIAVSSTNALVLVDQSGHPVRPAIMQLDRRSVTDAAILQQTLGDAITQAAGNVIAETGYWLPALRWLRTNEPESLARTRCVLYPAGYVTLQLCGATTMDRTRAATTLLFDHAEGTWSKLLAMEGGLSLAQLPPVYEPTEVVGRLRSEIADQVGLHAGIPVIGGAMDFGDQRLGAVAAEGRRRSDHAGHRCSCWSHLASCRAPRRGDELSLSTTRSVVVHESALGGRPLA